MSVRPNNTDYIFLQLAAKQMLHCKLRLFPVSPPPRATNQFSCCKKEKQQTWKFVARVVIWAANNRNLQRNVCLFFPWQLPKKCCPYYLPFFKSSTSVRSRSHVRVSGENGHQKRNFSKNALQRAIFWKRRFRILGWTPENGTFRKRWRHVVEFNGHRFRNVLFPVTGLAKIPIYYCYSPVLFSF